MYILFAILIFGFLIFIHELGHYITARIFGVTVYEFSIGMGPKILSIRSKKTNIKYSLGILPIGGYVSMAGEDRPEEDKAEKSKAAAEGSAPTAESTEKALSDASVEAEETSASPEATEANDAVEDNGQAEDEHPLCDKPAWQRFIVLAAGPLMNLIFGILIMCLLVSGFKQLSTTTVEGFYRMEDTGYTVSSYQSGLRAGDEIISINGSRVHIANQVVYEILHEGHEPVEMVVRRGEEELTLLVTFPTTTEGGQTLGAIDFATGTKEKTLWGTVEHAFYYSTSTIKMIWESIYDLFTGKYGIEAMSGPVGVTVAIGEAAKVGWASVVYLTVVISMNLGMMNLLPIPALDGGRLLFVVIEMIFRKPLPTKFENMANFIGLFLMFGLIIIILFKDVIQLFMA